MPFQAEEATSHFDPGNARKKELESRFDKSFGILSPHPPDLSVPANDAGLTESPNLVI